VLFLLPQYPDWRTNPADFNFAPIVVLGSIILLTIWWLVSERKVFKGPIIQGDEATLEQIESRIEAESVYKEADVIAR
jgi:hypothetical protein